MPPSTEAQADGSTAALAEPDTADHVVVFKDARRMYLWRDGAILRSYEIALGFSPVGDKRREGDGRTPEGRYVIDFANPNSAFHLSLRISYPEPDQRTRATKRGIDPGRDIFIHGLGTGPRALARTGDWTDGCIAVSNAEMEDIFRLVPVGTPISIMP